MISSNLQNLINSADIGTVFLDRSLRVVLFTPAARSVFNLIPADHGRPLSDITSRLEDNSILKDAKTVLEQLSRLEREIRTTDGRTLLIRLSPYRTEDDRIQGVVISMVDITERKQSEQAIRESEEKYRTLFDTMAEGYALCGIVRDAAGQVIDLNYLDMNRALERQTGFDRRTVIGRYLSDVFTKDNVARFMPVYAGAANSSGPMVTP